MCLIVYITNEIVKQIDHKKYSIGVSRTKKRYIRSNYTLPSFTIWYRDKEVNTFLLVSSFKQNKVFIDSESFSLIENIEHRRNHFHFRYWWIVVNGTVLIYRFHFLLIFVRNIWDGISVCGFIYKEDCIGISESRDSSLKLTR